MAKFKKGDNVICIQDSLDGSFFGHPGETFIVSECLEGDVIFEEMKLGDLPVDACRFQLIEKYNEKDLDFLIRTANQGLRAESVLLTKHFAQVQRRHSSQATDNDWHVFTHNPYNGYSVYRVKVKPAFESFYVGEKTCCWNDPVTGMGAAHTGTCNTGDKLVKLEGETIFIGAYSFDLKELHGALADLTRDSKEVCVVSNRRLGCMRNGICIDGKTQISWSDADRILEALDKAGI